MQEKWVWSLGWEGPLSRKWQPTPVFLPGKFHEQRNLVGYSPGCQKESDTDWVTRHTHKHTLVFYCIQSFVYVNLNLPLYSSPLSRHRVCFLHLWLCFSFVNKFICTIFLDFTYNWYHIVSIFVWLTSLSIAVSRSIYDAANGIILSFLMDGWYSIVYMRIYAHTNVWVYICMYIYIYCIFFIQSSVDGCLSCFHVLVIVNSAAMYVFKLWFSLDICPGVESLDYMIAPFLVFSRNLCTVLHRGCTNLYFHQELHPPHPLQHLLFVDFWWWTFWPVSGDASR